MTDALRQPIQAVTDGIGRRARRVDDAHAGRFTTLIDAGFVASTVAAVVTEAVVVWFHVMFVLLVVAALLLPLRPLVVRLTVWALVATSLVTWDVIAHDTPSDELAELPILTFVIVLVFFVARSRELSHGELKASQELVRDRLEAERDALRTQLEQSQRLDVMGRASTRMAHDLRNLLAIVQWCAADLIEDEDERYRRRGRETAEAVQRGVEMLDEMLALGRAQYGDRDVISLGDTLRKASPLLGHLVPSGVRLDVRLPERDAEIRMSRTELMQVLMNLLSNAADAVGPTGRISLDIDVVSRMTPKGRCRRLVTITVADDGHGVDPALLSSVFDPGVSTKDGPHSGLGLSTVWTIVARAGGTTELTSSSSGSRVDIAVPVADDYVQYRAVIEVADTGNRALLEHEFSALGFVVEQRTATELSDEPTETSPVVIVHDSSVTEHPATVDRARCRLVDITPQLDDDEPTLTRERAAIVVRRIVDGIMRHESAA